MRAVRAVRAVGTVRARGQEPGQGLGAGVLVVWLVRGASPLKGLRKGPQAGDQRMRTARSWHGEPVGGQGQRP